MIDDNELLPVTTAAVDRTRASRANVIGVYTLPLPDETSQPEQYAKEVEKCKQHKRQLRNVAFQAARILYKDKTALAAFGIALEEVRTAFSAGPATRHSVARKFYSKKSLDQILNKVTKEILGVDTVDNQLKFLKTTKKTKEVTCKEWLRSLTEIEKSIYWF